MSLKNKLFMLEKIKKDLLRNKIAYSLADNLTSQQLGYYYFLFDENRVSKGKDQALINKFDKNGIPINKTYIDVTDKDFVYFPISIGQMGLSVFHTFLKTNSEEDKNRFLKFAEWFYDNATVTEKLGAIWYTDVALPQYKNTKAWQSAFTQSRGISILLRAYQITKEEKYAILAEKALIPFNFSVEEGGVTAFTKWGAFYEEYTSSEPTLVLNGKIFAICGLQDFVRVFPEHIEAKKLLKEGIQTIKNILPEFNLGFWSRYNLCSADWHPKIDPATIGYQRLHISQLKMLYKLTREEVFKKYYLLFEKQDNLFNAFRMYLLKYKSLKKIGRL